MWFLAGAGAIIAGLFLSLRELAPWFEAQRTGAIRTRGSRSEKVLRDAEPERFSELAGRRLKAAGPGLLFILGGLVWLAWNALGVWVATAG